MTTADGARLRALRESVHVKRKRSAAGKVPGTDQLAGSLAGQVRYGVPSARGVTSVGQVHGTPVVSCHCVRVGRQFRVVVCTLPDSLYSISKT